MPGLDGLGAPLDLRQGRGGDSRKSSLVVPGGLPVTARVAGDALTVLHTVVSDWPPT
jgi:hypothetical protein